MLLKLFIGTSRFLFLLVMVIVTVALGGYIAFLTYQTIFYIPNVNVPSVLSMEINNAQQVLHQTGLKMLVIDEPLFREGDHLFVVGQDPSPGTEIKKNRTVEVEVRETKVSNQVPNIIGKTTKEAEALLAEQGYSFGNIAYSMHHQLSQGRIIAQNPNPGENIGTNGEVNILVSKGLY